jgi:hypothetical protein
MKQILITILIFPLLVSCQSKDYPELINKVAKYDNNDYEKEHFSEFAIYEEATTKNINLPKAKILANKKYPWETSASEKRTVELANQIKKTITATTDGASEYNKEPSSTICFYSLVDNFFTEQQLSEYKKTGTITTQKSILDYIKATIIAYELTNEKNEKIKLKSEVLGHVGGGFEEKNGKLLDGIGFETLVMGNSEYLRLNGYIDIEIEIPTEYEKVEITKNDIGNKFSIGEQKIQILEFDANVMHYKLFDTRDRKSSIYIDDRNGNFGEVTIPESLYIKFRNNQGLDYNSFLKKYKEFGLDKIEQTMEGNYVSVLKSDECQFEKVIFYCPVATKVVKTKIRVPVNINIK